MKSGNCSVIIKTHNSQKFLPKCLEALEKQTLPPKQIIILDSASDDPSYLPIACEKCEHDSIVVKEDIGFCRGNNIGYQSVFPNTEFVLFLNPDAFLTSSVLEEMVNRLKAYPKVGIATGTLHGYDIDSDSPTHRLDSTGIFRKWNGSWFDRKIPASEEEKVPAICGAFLFCRKKAIDEVVINGNEVFDSSFFMYKEDVDLSLRMRKKGWDLVLFPDIKIFHCRGWRPNRREVSRKNRLLSARNDIRIDRKNKSPYFFVSILKYLAVSIFDL